MASNRAIFVRYVRDDEVMDDLVEEAKALTYEHYCEFALFELSDGRRVLVRGGPYGIELEETGSDALIWVVIEGEAKQVAILIFHTHPKPTGPSDDDLRMLEKLGQKESLLFELFGPRNGTVIRPKDR